MAKDIIYDTDLREAIIKKRFNLTEQKVNIFA